MLPFSLSLPDGYDVTDQLGIQLYQPPIAACLAGDVVGVFPRFIPKTDQERIQNHRWILDELRDEEWVVTEKIDGSSCAMVNSACAVATISLNRPIIMRSGSRPGNTGLKKSCKG